MEDWVHPISRDARRVPKGIGPGWDYNPGDTDMAARAAKTAMDKLVSLPPHVGAEALEESLSRLPKAELEAGGVAPAVLRHIVNTGLLSWLQKPNGNFPLMIIPKQDAAVIGSTASVAKLSPETLDKQQRHHPELTVQDYALAQDAVEKGKKYVQDDRNIAYVLNKGGGVVVIVKATQVGNELFVTSLRTLSGKPKKREEEVARLRRGKMK